MNVLPWARQLLQKPAELGLDRFIDPETVVLTVLPAGQSYLPVRLDFPPEVEMPSLVLRIGKPGATGPDYREEVAALDTLEQVEFPGVPRHLGNGKLEILDFSAAPCSTESDSDMLAAFTAETKAADPALAAQLAADSPRCEVPWLLNTYLEGKSWAEQLPDLASPGRSALDTHARRCGEMHQITAAGRGKLTTSAGREQELRLAEVFERQLDEMASRFPQLLRGARLQQALAVERKLREYREAFADLGQFSLVHGDLGLTNLVGKLAGAAVCQVEVGPGAAKKVSVETGGPQLLSETLGYLDFEWAALDDPVRDLVYVGGRIGAGPWYAQLDAEELVFLLEAHAQAMGTTEELSAQTLRRDAWEIYERCLSSWDFYQRIGTAADRDRRYEKAVAALESGLDDWLGR